MIPVVRLPSGSSGFRPDFSKLAPCLSSQWAYHSHALLCLTDSIPVFASTGVRALLQVRNTVQARLNCQPSSANGHDRPVTRLRRFWAVFRSFWETEVLCSSTMAALKNFYQRQTLPTEVSGAMAKSSPRAHVFTASVTCMLRLLTCRPSY